MKEQQTQLLAERQQRIGRQFARAVGTYGTEAVVQREAAQALLEDWEALCPEGARRVLEIGCGTGTFTRLFLARHRPERMILNDLCPEAGTAVSDLLDDRVRFVCGDAERMAPPDFRPDLLVSCSAIQWMADPPAFAARCLDWLAPGGRMALVTYAPGNLEEIRRATGAGLAYASLEDYRQAVGSRGRFEYTAEESRTLYFPSARDVLRHLKRTGVNGNSRPEYPWTRSRLEALERDYPGRHPESGLVPLTYRPLRMIIRKPGKSPENPESLKI